MGETGVIKNFFVFFFTKFPESFNEFQKFFIFLSRLKMAQKRIADYLKSQLQIDDWLSSRPTLEDELKNSVDNGLKYKSNADTNGR